MKQIARYLVPLTQALEILGHIEPCQQRINIGCQEWLGRYTLIGVAGRHVDVLLDERLREQTEGCAIIEWRTDKAGKYDGRLRHRIAMRMPMHGMQPIYAHIRLSREPGWLTVEIVNEYGARLEIGAWPMLRYEVYSGGLERIAGGKMARYFTHLLDHPDVSLAIKNWVTGKEKL